MSIVISPNHVIVGNLSLSVVTMKTKVSDSLGALLLLGASAGGARAAAAVTSGSFNVLSMNVAGLPAILNNNGVPGKKTTNSELIGTKFGEYGYDLIHAQEVCWLLDWTHIPIYLPLTPNPAFTLPYPRLHPSGTIMHTEPKTVAFLLLL